MRACATRDGAICAKNSTFDYFDRTNPIIREGIKLRCPTLIMAPVLLFFLLEDFNKVVYIEIHNACSSSGG